MSVQTHYSIAGATRDEIVRSIEAGVDRDALSPGDLLPSVRSLAATLTVSPATVAAAYRELRARGVVISRPRRGVRVAHRPPLATRSSTAPAAVRGDIVDLATGNPDPSLLPRMPIYRPPRRPRLYGDPPHLAELLDLIGDDFEADGVATGHLVATGGALDGIDRVLDVHLRPGDRVAVEDPCWTGIRDLVQARGLDPVGVAVDDLGMDPDGLSAALANGAVAVIVTPRAHNPMGAAVDATRAGDLRAVLTSAPHVVLIEDDHAAMVGGVPYRTLTGGPRRWAVVRSVAKALGPDLRVAVMAGDRDTVTRVAGRLRLGPGWVSTILQRLVVLTLRDPATRPALERAAAVYAERRQALIAALAAMGVPATGRSGLNVWVPVPEEAFVVTGMERAGWAVRAGEPFRLTAGPAVRITTAALDPSDAPRVAIDLASLLRGPAGTRSG